MATLRKRSNRYWQARAQEARKAKIALICTLKHRDETLEAKAERSIKIVIFRNLADLGIHCNLPYKQIWIRCHPPVGYMQLDLTDPEQLALGILKTIRELSDELNFY